MVHNGWLVIKCWNNLKAGIGLSCGTMWPEPCNYIKKAKFSNEFFSISSKLLSLSWTLDFTFCLVSVFNKNKVCNKFGTADSLVRCILSRIFFLQKLNAKLGLTDFRRISSPLLLCTSDPHTREQIQPLEYFYPVQCTSMISKPTFPEQCNGMSQCNSIRLRPLVINDLSHYSKEAVQFQNPCITATSVDIWNLFMSFLEVSFFECQKWFLKPSWVQEL